MTTVPTIDDPSLDEGEPGIDLFALLCERRGWSPERLADVEDPSHDELLNMPEAVGLLHRARRNGEKVVIVPDFDMDGISSGVLGYAGLSELGFDVELHLPDYRRGHDVGPADMAEIAAKWPETALIVTCDGGVNAHAGVADAHARGWKVLITDHHEELEPGSSADVTVDPCAMAETYSHPGICGAHVLYQVIEAYARVHAPEKTWEVHLLRLFAGLGTVSDVMPLLYENRQMVRDSLSLARLLWANPPLTVPNKWGGMDPDPEAIDVEGSALLSLLSMDAHHPVFVGAFRGFALVLKAFALAGKLKDADGLDEGFYGFYLAPAMNAPRRTGAPLDDCFAAFTAPTPDAMLAAARRVIENNEYRKELTVRCVAELEEGDQPYAPWVYFSDAYTGMLGLLASYMMQTSGHVVAVLSRPSSPDRPVSGSGRAPVWFDIIDVLDPFDGMYGIGHQQACGVKLDSVDRVAELADVLATTSAVLESALGTGERVGDLVLGPDDDCDAGLDDLAPLHEFTRRISSLRPFGHGFEEPVVQLALDPEGMSVKTIGTESQHLRLTTRSGLSCLWWNAAAEHAEDMCGIVDEARIRHVGTLRVTAKMQFNTFRGETRVQAVVRDLLGVKE